MRKPAVGTLIKGAFAAVAILAVQAPADPQSTWLGWAAEAQEASSEKVFDVAILNGEVAEEEQLIRVTRGDTVLLRWTSDTPIEAHLHGYDIEVEVEPGAGAEMTFVAEFAGRFPVEAHVAGGHATLLYLEVHPD